MTEPLDHAKAQELFSDYRGGALPAERAAAVREHLRECAACKRDYDGFAMAVSSLTRLKVEAPPDFLSTIQGEIRRRSRGRFFARRSAFARFPLELVSLITLMIMLVVYLFLTVTEPKRVHEVGPGHGPASGAKP